MAGKSPWQDGRRAWENQLNHWWQYEPAKLTEPLWAQNSLEALEKVRLVRGLLDQAELHMVMTARLHGKSWVEIATRLGTDAETARAKWGETDGG